MKIKTIVLFLTLIFYVNSYGQFSSSKGHPEHLVGGIIIGGLTSYFVYQKTEDKLLSWIIAAGVASVVGLVKEWVDPLWFGDSRSFNDFAYTALGGMIGASVVIPLKKKGSKEKVDYLF
jgi:hypothetical protein